MKIINFIILCIVISFSPIKSYSQEAEQGSANYIKVVVFGDSLVSGYQLNSKSNFKNTLEKKLHSQNYKSIRIYNGAVEEQTTEIALSRVDTVIKLRPDIVILALGSNDAFNNVPLEKIFTNLDAILQKLYSYKIKVLLAGVRLPDGAKDEYTGQMAGMFEYLQRKYRVQLYPNLLEGVYGVPKNVVQDLIHPSAEGTKVMVEKIFPHLEILFIKQYRELIRNARQKRRQR